MSSEPKCIIYTRSIFSQKQSSKDSGEQARKINPPYQQRDLKYLARKYFYCASNSGKINQKPADYKALGPRVRSFRICPQRLQKEETIPLGEGGLFTLLKNPPIVLFPWETTLIFKKSVVSSHCAFLLV